MKKWSILLLSALVTGGNALHSESAPSNTSFSGVFLKQDSDPLPLGGNRKKMLLLLTWSERERPLTVTLDNPSASAVQITGIQTSTGLYINRLPEIIPARGTADIKVTYVTPQIERGVEMIRVRTSAGEQNILINRHRQSVVNMDGPVRWKLGDQAVPKTATFSINAIASGLRPVSVRIPISGFTASLKPLGGNRYGVEITPLSTAAPIKIPVLLEFDPALPGNPVIIDAAVVKSGEGIGPLSSK